MLGIKEYGNNIRRYLSLAALGIAIAALPFSIKFCHSGIIAFLLLWVSEGNWKEKTTLARQSILVKILLTFSIFQLLSIFYTDNTSLGWWILEKKIFLFLLPVALATTSLKCNPKEITQLIWIFVFSCLAGSLLCLVSAFHQVNLVSEGLAPTINFDYFSSANFKALNPAASERWLFFSYIALSEGINIHPSYLSLYLSFCIMFLWTQIDITFQKKTAWFLAILLLYFSAFIIFLSSRIVIICLVAVYIFGAIQLLTSSNRKVPALAFLLATFFIGSLLYINPVSRYRNFQELMTTTIEVSPNSVYTNSTEIRASLWWTSVKSLAHINVWWGTGAGDVDKTVRQISEAHGISNILESYNPHSQYFYTLLSNGIIGLILLLSCLGIPFYLSWTRRDYFCLGFIFLFAMLCITESALELQKGIAFFAILYPLLIFQLRSYQTLSPTYTLSAFARN